MYPIELLEKATEGDLNSLNVILKQLRSDPASHVPIALERLQEVLDNKNASVLVMRDAGTIIATGTLLSEDILTGRDGQIEDVVVDNEYRGKGLGMNLVEALIALGREKKIETIYLTSRPSRIAANKLYQKMGFTTKETNNYEMDL